MSERSFNPGGATRHEPIAIVGMGCRLPGAASAAELWRLLDEGVDAIGQYPGGRFPLIDSVYAGAQPGTPVATRCGGYLDGIDKFDADFFGISPREAAFLDPQQRLFLETVWESIEDAGIVAANLAGTRTGVFAGLWSNDYETCVREGAPETEFYSTTGTGRYSLSGRVSYFWDLRGPSLTIDAACSSSLAAIHLACRSLQMGDSDLAIAGGSNLILRPDITVAYSAAGMLSADGRCRFGDADASGYVRSEGAATIVLKRLSQAVADGDRIYAVIRGGAVNSIGRTSGSLITPSRTAQIDLIRTALGDAGVAPGAVDYVEAHGPGTPAGDPVEIEAIGRALSDGREKPLLAGSIKTNIGHTEATAGVAGVVKTALSLFHGRIPRSLHYRTPNPQIPWDSLAVRIASEPVEWNGNGPRYALVNSFGITGTNACVVLEDAPAQPAESEERELHLLPVSALTEPALKQSAGAWNTFLEHAADSSLTDVCYTATRRRTHGEQRLAVVGSDRRELAGALAAWSAGEPAPGVASGIARNVANWKLAFLFSGVGGQWPGMGTSLLRQNRVFRQRFEECAEAILRNGGPDVLSEIANAAATSRLSAAEIVQPAIWALQLATAKFWESLGFEPLAVAGHSMGEATAAVACGALSLDEGAALICERSRASKRVSRVGGMALAGVSAAIAAEFLEPYDGRLWIAGLNAAESTVISGDAPAIEELLDELRRRDIFCRRINSDVASHSEHMEEARPELEVALEHLAPRATDVAFYSTSTGHKECGSTLGCAYWGSNLRMPVLFWPAVKQMIAAGCNAFVEIGPHPVLLHSLEETIGQEGVPGVAVVTSHRECDEYKDSLLAIAALHCAGYPVDFGRLYPNGRCISLPAYPWQRERHWIEAREPQQQVESPADHLYEIYWTPVELPAESAAQARRVLVVGAPESAEGFASELRANGCAVGLVESLAVEGALAENRSLTDVIYLQPATGPFDPLTLSERLCEGVPELLGLLRALSSTTARLWIVTAGTQLVPLQEKALRLAHSTVAGLVGAIRREHPELDCRHIDWSESPCIEELRLAAKFFLSAQPEEMVAMRGDRVWAPRYRRAAIAGSPAALRDDATYLIAGGLGGVGLAIAGWMADRGARSIVLTGRRAPSTEAEARIAKIRKDGVDVRVIAADISQAQDVAELFSSISAMRPLRGIVHAAAVLDDALLADLTLDQVRRVSVPKLGGALNLHRCASSMPIDFFVLCSSMAVPVTQPGQGAYSAANRALDAFAAWRRSLGLPATSIQWGLWAETGLAKTSGSQRSGIDYANRGIRPLSSELGLGMLGAALRTEAPACSPSPFPGTSSPNPTRPKECRPASSPSSYPRFAPSSPLKRRAALRNG